LFFSLLDGYRQVPDSLVPALESIIAGVLASVYPSDVDAKTPEWVLKAKEFIVVSADRKINLEDLAEHLRYSRVHLCRMCQNALGMSLKEFFDNEKADLARKKLLYSSKKISLIASELGFNNVYSFSRFFKRVVGLSPSIFRKSAISDN
jgi:AraC family transcriptional activator of pobA